jgi:hypothetical protein
MATQRTADRERSGFRIPGRLAWGTHAFAAAMVGIYAAMAAATGGAFRAGTILLLGGGVLLWAALAWVTLPPRSSLPPTAGGEVPVVQGSRPLAVLLVTGCVLVLAGAATWAVPLVRDPQDVPHPGFVLVVGIAALGALPTAVRLLTGRLHVWRLELDQGLRYVGGRVDVTIPWPQVRALTLNEHATRLLVEPDEGPVLAVPMLVFDVPAAQVLVAADRARDTGTG